MHRGTTKCTASCLYSMKQNNSALYIIIITAANITQHAA